MSKKVIEWAAREKKRTVNAAVGRNFLKTITEPLTNSDSALKKQAGVSHGAGLIDEMLKLKDGDRVDTSAIKTAIPKATLRKVFVQLKTSGSEARVCRVIDTGPGMSRSDLESKFGIYAEAKARGEKTRSLFGRGALDVLLYHEESVIFSVANGILSRCQIYWEKDVICEVEELGRATKALLDSFKLPHSIAQSGTVVQFRLREGTPVPQEDQMVAKISGFYMLRLISADPNTEVTIERIRAGGRHTDPLTYDFPIGTVIGRFTEILEPEKGLRLPLDILVVRSDQPLQTDPAHIDRRENGLLFIDENDAVMDLTLLPEYDKNPYLQHVYGIVRIKGIRAVLEAKLEAEEAVAVLTETRDGFNQKHETTKLLFDLIERHVKPLYEKEEKRQKKGDVNRSDKLNERVKDALKVINQFNSEETEEEGSGPRPDEQKKDAIYFCTQSIRLYAGVPKRVSVFVNPDKINSGEVVLFASDNSEIKVEPDSETVKSQKGKAHQQIALTVSCNVKEQKGTLTALTLNKNGEECQATLKVAGVDDPPVFQPPEDIEFSSSHFSGLPNSGNKAVLLVNLDAFPGMPEVTFQLEEIVGSVSLSNEGESRAKIKVTKDQLIAGRNVARVPILFKGTGWGQHAVLSAKAKRSDGELAFAKCRVRFQRPAGNDKFSNFHYEDLDRNVLGEVAGDKIFINSGYALHRQIFGATGRCAILS